MRRLLMAMAAAMSMAVVPAAMAQARFRVEVVFDGRPPMGSDCQTVTQVTEFLRSIWTLPGIGQACVQFLDVDHVEDVTAAVVRSWTDMADLVFEPREPVREYHLRGVRRLLRAVQGGPPWPEGGGAARKRLGPNPPKPTLDDLCRCVRAGAAADGEQVAMPAPPKRPRAQRLVVAPAASPPSGSEPADADTLRRSGVSVPAIAAPARPFYEPRVEAFLELAIDLESRTRAGTLTAEEMLAALRSSPLPELYIPWMVEWMPPEEWPAPARRQ